MSPPRVWTWPAAASSPAPLRDHAQAGGTVVMATHDLDFAEQVADDISMMFDGEIACMEPPTDFFADNVFYRA